VEDKRISAHWPISLTNGAATLFNLFLPIALVRIMSPDQVGRYKIFFLYVMLSPGIFLVGGLTNGLYHWGGKYPQTKTEVRQSWTWFLVITLLVVSLSLSISPWLAPLLKMSKTDLLLFLYLCPFSLCSVFFEDLLIARGDIWKGSFYGSGTQVFRAAAVMAAAWWGRTIEWVLGAFLGATILRAFVGWFLHRRSGDVRLFYSAEKSSKVLHYAFPVSIAALSGFALQNVDQVILSIRLHPAEFAFYAMGCLSIPPLQVLEMSVNRVMIPRLSHCFAAKELKNGAKLMSESVEELFRILLPATAGLIIFSHPIIRILFTDRYIAAAHYLRFYALFYLIMSIPYDGAARAKGDGVWILRMALIFAPLSICATWISATHWGAMGALIAFLTVQALIRAYSLYYQRRWFAVPYSQFLPLRNMAIQTALVLSAGAVSLSLRPVFASEKDWFFVSGALFAVLYLWGAYWLTVPSKKTVSQPVHILELVQFPNVGGLERMVLSLSRALNHTERFVPAVAAYDRLEDSDDSSLAGQFGEARVPLIQWEKKPGFSPAVVFKLIKEIFLENRRILHVHDLGPLIYGSLAKCLSMGRVELVVTLHTLLQVNQSDRYRFYFKCFLRFADRIVAVSRNVKDGLIELGIDPERIDIVPNGVSFSAPLIKEDEKLALRRMLMPGADRSILKTKWILYLARLHHGKGQDIALDVWCALPREIRSELAMFFVGPETEKGCAIFVQQKIRRSPDSERIFIVGPSRHPQQWLQAADIFVSGSRHEGMPLAPLEAAGSGLPALLSDIPGHSFLKSWAYYFNPEKPVEGAKKIIEIIGEMKKEGSPSFFQKRWNAATILRERWSEEAMATSYVNVFDSMWEVPEKEMPENVYAAL